jgi:hypothetical protein
MELHVEFHFQNKFEKLVHLVGFIIRKFVTMHGHMTVKKSHIFMFVQYISLHVPKLPQHLHIRGTALICFIFFLLCFHIPYNYRQMEINKYFEQVRTLSASAFYIEKPLVTYSLVLASTSALFSFICTYFKTSGRKQNANYTFHY